MSGPKRNPRVMRGDKVLISVAIDPDQVKAVDQIADEKRTSRSQLFREAVALWLAVNGKNSGKAA